jgi:hypothetical protein
LSRQASRKIRLTGVEVSICVSTRSASTAGERQRAFVVDLGIRRHQEVAAVDLQAMAGVEEQSDLGTLQLITKALDRLFEARLVRIDSQFNLETELLQGFGQSARVIGGFGSGGAFW